MRWTTSGGEADWYNAKGAWWAGEFVAPPSDWDHNDSWFGSPNWSGSTVKLTYHVDYINWTWQWNDVKTEAFHRITLIGNPGGYLNWSTNHWHTGEDAGLLSAQAGHHSGCPEGC